MLSGSQTYRLGDWLLTWVRGNSLIPPSLALLPRPWPSTQIIRLRSSLFVSAISNSHNILCQKCSNVFRTSILSKHHTADKLMSIEFEEKIQTHLPIQWKSPKVRRSKEHSDVHKIQMWDQVCKIRWELRKWAKKGTNHLRQALLQAAHPCLEKCNNEQKQKPHQQRWQYLAHKDEKRVKKSSTRRY